MATSKLTGKRLTGERRSVATNGCIEQQEKRRCKNSTIRRIIMVEVLAIQYCPFQNLFSPLAIGNVNGYGEEEILNYQI